MTAPAPTELAPRRARLELERHGEAACDLPTLLTLLLGDDVAASAAAAAIAAVGGLGSARAAGEAGLRAAGCARRDALALTAALELGRRAAAAWPAAPWSVRTPADVAERLLPAMGGLEREELRVLLLNTKNAITAARTVYVGNLAGSSVRVGEVFRDAVRACAAGIVVVHNHPSGDPAPSAEDLRVTRELVAAGRLLDIQLVDHLVIGHGRWVSLRALGALDVA